MAEKSPQSCCSPRPQFMGKSKMIHKRTGCFEKRQHRMANVRASLPLRREYEQRIMFRKLELLFRRNFTTLGTPQRKSPLSGDCFSRRPPGSVARQSVSNHQLDMTYNGRLIRETMRFLVAHGDTVRDRFSPRKDSALHPLSIAIQCQLRNERLKRYSRNTSCLSILPVAACDSLDGLQLLLTCVRG